MLPWCLPPSFSSIRHCSGADNNWRLSRWPPWRPSWIPFWWRCWKCEKLLTDIQMRDRPWSTTHGISWPGAKLKVGYQQKIFKMAAVVAIMDIVTECFFSNSESPCCLNASHQVFAQSDLPFWRRWGLKIFKMATLEAISDNMRTEQF